MARRTKEEALALAKVVVILFALISDVAMLANIAFLWLSVLPKWFTFLPCLIAF